MHETSKRSLPPGTLLQENRGRGTAGKATWNAFAGIPCQVDGKKRHLERFCGKTVAGGRREETLGTLSQENRGRWTARRDTWYTFAGKPCQVEGKKRHLVHFRRKTVPGGRQEETPGTLSREFRARWTARWDTWNAFAEKPCQVDSKRCYLTRFRRDSVAGGRRRRDTWNALAGIPCQVEGGEETPGTLSREFRARWTAGKATWNTFAGIPCQVEGGMGHLERFRGNSVPGGRQRRDTWNTFAGIPWQVDGRKSYLEAPNPKGYFI